MWVYFLKHDIFILYRFQHPTSKNSQELLYRYQISPSPPKESYESIRSIQVTNASQTGPQQDGIHDSFYCHLLDRQNIKSVWNFHCNLPKKAQTKNRLSW